MTREEALATLYARCQHCEETDRAFAFLAEEPTVEPQGDLISRETLLKYAVYVELANGNKGWVIEKGYVEDLPTVELAEVTKNDD